MSSRYALRTSIFLFTLFLVLSFTLVLPTAYAHAANKSESITLPVKQSKSLIPKGQKEAYTVTSSNAKIVAITKSKRIKAKKYGNAVVKIVNNKTKTTATYKIKVCKAIKKIKLSTSTKQGWSGETTKIKARLTPSKKVEKPSWSSSNTKVATVSSSGKVTFKAAGTATITAKSNNGKVKKRIKITSYGSPAFTSGTKLSIEQGATKKLALAKGGNSKKIKWSTNNSKVLTVSQNGTITARCPGKADVTASVSKKNKTTCRVTITCSKGLLTSQMLQNHKITSTKKLAIVAHPDDETLWGGGSMLSGDWFIVCLTNGNTPYRAAEFRNVLQASHNQGVILNYPDDSYKSIRDDWSTCSNGIEKDLALVIQAQNWDEIVTYNPDGVTGHLHHRLTQKIVDKICKNTKDASGKSNFDKLYYYGVFYSSDNIPSGLPAMDEEKIAFKKSLLNLYPHESKAIAKYWAQMIPYENWIKATQWRQSLPSEESLSALPQSDPSTKSTETLC